MKRRAFVKSSVAVASGSLAVAACGSGTASGSSMVKKSRINHSVCKWCYPDISVAELARSGKEFGLQSVELLEPEEWPAVTAEGLICSMANGVSQINRGFNRIEHHEWLVPGFEERIRQVADAGFPNVICFSGNRAGLDDDQGLKNCMIGLQQIMPSAEKFGVTVCMELLNSRVDHKDYQCDHTDWGVELVRQVGSDRFRLLYDIYHMQIMEGDVIRTIRDNMDSIAHFHTGGNPGRHEIDETQELNYAAIMEAIADSGYAGFVAQEFIPTRDPLTSLQSAVKRCSV